MFDNDISTKQPGMNFTDFRNLKRGELRSIRHWHFPNTRCNILCDGNDNLAMMTKAKIRRCNNKHHTVTKTTNIRQSSKLNTVTNAKLYDNNARQKFGGNHCYCLYHRHGCQLVQRWNPKSVRF